MVIYVILTNRGLTRFPIVRLNPSGIARRALKGFWAFQLSVSINMQRLYPFRVQCIVCPDRAKSIYIKQPALDKTTRREMKIFYFVRKKNFQIHLMLFKRGYMWYIVAQCPFELVLSISHSLSRSLYLALFRKGALM